LVQINLAKLASSADDSAGAITDTRGYVDEVLEKVCYGAAYGSNEARRIFLQSVKDAVNKAFDGWDEFACDILVKTARLAEEDTAPKMYAVIDALYAKASEKAYSKWYNEFDALIRLEMIKATKSAAEADAFIDVNLDINNIRRVAIQNAVNRNDYSVAETLCLEKLLDDAARNSYSRPLEWRYLLFDVYDKSGDTQKKIDTAMDLLFRFDAKYYPVMKELLTERGVWEQEYSGLLAELGNSLPYHMYMDILSIEGESAKLLEAVRRHRESVFTYGKQLAEKFQDDVCAICRDDIFRQAGEAENRPKYKKVCANIKRLFDYGGASEADSLIAELIEKYPRRPAFLEELDAMADKLVKKRSKTGSPASVSLIHSR